MSNIPSISHTHGTLSDLPRKNLSNPPSSVLADRAEAHQKSRHWADIVLKYRIAATDLDEEYQTEQAGAAGFEQKLDQYLIRHFPKILSRGK